MNILYASGHGAALDSDLLTGGGTDDTVALQSLLDLGGHVVVDGPALVSGLNIHSNTTLEFTGGAGLFLKPNSNRAILRNANRSRGAIIDKQIAIRGGFFNCNDVGQVGQTMNAFGLAIQEADKSLMVGMQFLGIEDLLLENVYVYLPKAFGIHIANDKRVTLINPTVDVGTPAAAPPIGKDGVHFNGPSQYVNILAPKIRSWDDALAFNANDTSGYPQWAPDMTINNDWGPYLGQGPITDVSVYGPVFMGAAQGIRLMSFGELIDRIYILGAVGTVQSQPFMQGNLSAAYPAGNFGSRITVDASKIAIGDGSNPPPPPPPPPPSGDITAVFLGATGEDKTNGLDAVPDGNPDWHFRISNLTSDPIRVRIDIRWSGGQSAWEWPLNAAGNWIVVKEYAAGVANCWVRNPNVTATGFTITVTYSDNSTDQVTI